LFATKEAAHATQAIPDRRDHPEASWAEVLLSQGRNVSEACRQIGVTDNTYYRWRKEYGVIRSDQAKRLKELERENARLKKLVAEAELDKAILREAASGNF